MLRAGNIEASDYREAYRELSLFFFAAFLGDNLD